MTESILPPIHPGEILREEFLVPLNMSAADLADHLGVAHSEIDDIVAERAPITADMASRLEKHFGTSVELWTNFQSAFDLKTTGGDTKEQIVVVRVTMASTHDGDLSTKQLWAAAVPRHEAVETVARTVPAGSSVALTDIRLTEERVQRLGLKAGDVVELSG